MRRHDHKHMSHVMILLRLRSNLLLYFALPPPHLQLLDQKVSYFALGEFVPLVGS